MRNSAFALIALVVFAMPDSTLAADDKAEAVKFQGVWRYASYVESGKNKPKESREKTTLKFDGEKFTLRNDGTFVDAGTWKLDTGKKPMELTLVQTEGDHPGFTLNCIYRWDDEDLQVCFGEYGDDRPRPTKFESDSKNKNSLIRLTKLKK